VTLTCSNSTLSLALDEVIAEIEKKEPDVRDDIDFAKKELEKKRLELGDELYNQWILSHFVSIQRLIDD